MPAAVIIGIKAFFKICLNITTFSFKPLLLAVSTKSAFFISSIEALVILAILAEKPVPNTITGIIYDFKSPIEKVDGSKFKLIEKFNISINPIQKFGIDNPIKAKEIKMILTKLQEIFSLLLKIYPHCLHKIFLS